jgi:hypothetical protein
MIALFFRPMTQPSLLSPANEILPNDRRSSYCFSTGNSSSSSFFSRQITSSFFPEVIPSDFLFSFQRDKGMNPQERVITSSVSVEWGEDR